MEFYEKLQMLRKREKLTQEELAKTLYVSRTAISKWESGRGYPSIDSLKAIAKLFDISIDELLSGDELLTIADEEKTKNQNHFMNLIFALVDICAVLFLFLPLFVQRKGQIAYAASLLELSTVQPYIKTSFLVIIVLTALFGFLMLALQNVEAVFGTKNKSRVSLCLGILLLLTFILTQHPYAAVLSLFLLIIKIIVLTKRK